MIEYFKWPYNISLPVYFANRQWAVTKYGLECLTSDYPIERLRLSERHVGTNLSMWVLHMTEKDWCDIREFAEALEMAMLIHKVKGRSLIDMTDSLTAALRKIEQNKKFDRFVDDLEPNHDPSKMKVYSMADITAAHDLYQEHVAKKR